MNRILSILLFAVFTASSYAQTIDSDGYKNPLQRLDFYPVNHYEFELANIRAVIVYDPFERANRYIYYFNTQVDVWVLLPTVKGYKKITPTFVQNRVSNFFSNLGDVSNLANSILQLKPKRSMFITARLMFNTVFGLGGLWDPATKMGLPKQTEDFGQTLGFYGIPSGPYIVLPFLGPSNLRDTVGRIADSSLNNYVNYLGVAEESNRHPLIYGLQIIDTRATTDFQYGVLNSPFEYEKIRYIYTKARELQINE